MKIVTSRGTSDEGNLGSFDWTRWASGQLASINYHTLLHSNLVVIFFFNFSPSPSSFSFPNFGPTNIKFNSHGREALTTLN